MKTKQAWFYRLKFFLLYSPVLSFFLIISSICLFPMLGWICSIDFMKFEVDYKYIGFGATYLLFYLNFRSNSLKSLFSITSEFNNRYDNLNNLFNIQQFEKHHVYDYFNLCAEEYYFYSHGLIPNDVWKCWLKGMEDMFSKEGVSVIAEEEFCNGISESYYGFNPYSLKILQEKEC